MTWNAVMIQHVPKLLTVLELKTSYQPISGGFWVLKREQALEFEPEYQRVKLYLK